MNDFEIVKEKIRKLMNLSKNNPNHHEASLAALRAKQLLDAHNLREEDIDLCEEDITTKIVDLFGYYNIPYWKRRLASAVSTLFEVKIFMHRQMCPDRVRVMRSDYVFIGYKSDVEVATFMFSRLCEVVDASAYSCFYGVKKKKGVTTKEQNSFRVGFVMALVEKLESYVRHAHRSPREEALVEAKGMNIDRYIQRRFTLGKGKAISASVNDKASLVAGYEAGQLVPVNPAMKPSKAEKQQQQAALVAQG